MQLRESDDFSGPRRHVSSLPESEGKSRKQLCANPKRVSPYQRGSLTRHPEHVALAVTTLTKNQITKKKSWVGKGGR